MKFITDSQLLYLTTSMYLLSPRNVFFGLLRPDVWRLLSIASCFARKNKILATIVLSSSHRSLFSILGNYLRPLCFPLFTFIIAKETSKTTRLSKTAFILSLLVFSSERSFFSGICTKELVLPWKVQLRPYTRLRYGSH